MASKKTKKKQKSSKKTVKIKYDIENKDHTLVFEGKSIVFNNGIAIVDNIIAEKILKKENYSLIK